MFKIELLTKNEKIVDYEVDAKDAFQAYAHVKGHPGLVASRLLDEDGDELDSYGDFPPPEKPTKKGK